MLTPSSSRRHLVATIFLASAGLAALPALAADHVVGSGKLATETRANLSDFQAVAGRGSVKLVIRQAAKESVQVRADDNLLPLVETSVETQNGARTLVVSLRQNVSIQTSNEIVVSVDVVKLNALSSSGSGDIVVEALSTPALKLNLSGSGDARLTQLKTDDLAIGVSGSSDVDASGRAAKLSVSISGSGGARLRELQADEAAVSIAGSGDAELSVAKTLSVSIAGSGDVVYHGDAKVASRVAGSGSVTRR
jgi:hypothetical protein